MTEVGGPFSRVAPEELRHRLSPVAATIGDALTVNACQKKRRVEVFAENADVTFERKMNCIFGSINSSST